VKPEIQIVGWSETAKIVTAMVAAMPVKNILSGSNAVEHYRERRHWRSPVGSALARLAGNVCKGSSGHRPECPQRVESEVEADRPAAS
jgi:hypothetical protein